MRLKLFALINSNSNDILLEKLLTKPIDIGVAVPLTNHNAEAGKSILSSVNILADKINQAGGIQGRDLKIHSCDDKVNSGDSLSLTECAQKFVDLGMKAVIGHLSSEQSIASSVLYQEHNILQFSPTAVYSGFTRQADNRGLLFRVVPLDSLYSKTLANLIDRLNVDFQLDKTMMIHTGNLYTSNILAQTIAMFRDSPEIDIEALDLKQNPETQFETVLKDHPDYQNFLLLGHCYDLEKVISLLNQKALNQKVNLIVLWNSLLPYGRVDDFKLAENLSLYIVAPDFDVEHPEYINFKSTFQNQQDVSFNFAALLAYISAKTLFAAFDDYYAGNYPSLTEAMHSKEFSAFGDSFVFDEYGDRKDSSLAIYRRSKNQFSKIKAEIKL